MKVAAVHPPPSSSMLIFYFHMVCLPQLMNPCCCSVAQLFPAPCDPRDCSTPGLPVPHHLPEFADIHVRCIGDAVQPSHPLTPSSPSALDLSQHQGKIMNPCSLLFTKIHPFFWFPSVQFSRSVVSDFLRPHESQHARPPCPPLTPGVHSDSRPQVSDAIQPSHPRLSPFPPAPNPSQHQSLFQ